MNEYLIIVLYITPIFVILISMGVLLLYLDKWEEQHLEKTIQSGE